MTTHTTQTTELPKHINDKFDKDLVEYKWLEQKESLMKTVGEEPDYGKLVTKKKTHVEVETAKKWFAQTLETEVQKAVEAERKRWHSPFDGLEIKLMYRDGDKVLQNKHIFSLEQISFVKGFFEVVQLKFSYMLKDLLANSLSHKEKA